MSLLCTPIDWEIENDEKTKLSKLVFVSQQINKTNFLFSRVWSAFFQRFNWIAVHCLCRFSFHSVWFRFCRETCCATTISIRLDFYLKFKNSDLSYSFSRSLDKPCNQWNLFWSCYFGSLLIALSKSFNSFNGMKRRQEKKNTGNYYFKWP